MPRPSRVRVAGKRAAAPGLLLLPPALLLPPSLQLHLPWRKGQHAVLPQPTHEAQLKVVLSGSAHHEGEQKLAIVVRVPVGRRPCLCWLKRDVRRRARRHTWAVKQRREGSPAPPCHLLHHPLGAKVNGGSEQQLRSVRECAEARQRLWRTRVGATLQEGSQRMLEEGQGSVTGREGCETVHAHSSRGQTVQTAFREQPCRELLL
mmetsp:Transcript_44666/g.149070  ORF Transcript_44666/g.149070 Transcript_44666/m.149070 type:complete len:205 (-) Transcript_44666:2697-3311(-)